MTNEQKKALKEALKNEVNPLLIGLRNELKNIASKLNDANEGTGVIFTKGTMAEFADLKRAITPVKDVDYFDGKTPIKGTDYYTEKEKNEFLKAVTPKKGKDYFTAAEKLAFKKAVMPKKGRDYFDGATPIKGKDYFTDSEIKDFLSRVTPIKGVHYRDGKDGEPGKKGADGTKISAEDIRDKLESLRGKARLKMSAIKGLEETLDRLSLKEFSNPVSLGGSEEGGGGGSTNAEWGFITGTLSDQSDLVAALGAKVTANSSITGATKTKVTYDAKGLVTGGADATTSDIAEGANLYYTAARFNTAFAAKTTADLTEGANLYFTEARVRSSVLTGLSVTGSSVVSTDTILQAFGKVQNQINALVGGVNYQGTWNANTNSPSLSSGVGTKGFYYVVATAGSTNLDGITDWKLGDWAIFNGTTWEKVDNTDAVISVNGYTGAVTLVTTDIAEGTNLYHTTARARGAIAGTSARISYNSSTGVIDIDGTYVGQTSITTLGTITTGTWSATTIAVNKGGTGATTLTGILKGNGTSAVTAVTAPSGAIVGDTDTQVLTNKTLQAGIIDYVIEPASDDTYEGEVSNDVNAGDTIAQWDCVYLDNTSGRWEFTDADAAATAGNVLVAMATAAGTDGNPLNVLFRGIVRNDGWNWTTKGAPLYLSTTAGAITETAPSGTDDVVRVIGHVISDDCIYFNPSNDWITCT